MSDLVRGAVRVLVLHHAEAAPVYGVWLMERLTEYGYTVSPGTLYPILHRLEEEGLLASKKSVVGGRSRRAYALTPAGARALRADRRALEALAAEVLS